MSKIHVDVILKHGIDDQGFADSFNSETEAYCKNILETISKDILVLRLL